MADFDLLHRSEPRNRCATLTPHWYKTSGNPLEILLVVLGGSHSYKIDYIGDFCAPKSPRKLLKINGRGERIRTSDPLVPNQVRYQTALRPEPLVVKVSLQKRRTRWLRVVLLSLAAHLAD